MLSFERKDNFYILDKVEIHVCEWLLYWKDLSGRIEESQTVMEAEGDKNIQDFAAQIPQGTF